MNNMKIKKSTAFEFKPVTVEVTVETQEEFNELTRAALDDDCCPARDFFIELAQEITGAS
jgi:hypothetical protein